MNIKILFGIYTFLKWQYENNIRENNIYLKGALLSSIADLEKFESTSKNIYKIHNYNNKYTKILNIDKIKQEFSDTQNSFFISEYNPPYLLDDKLMILRFFLLIYVVNNTIKCYCFDDVLVLTSGEKYSSEDENPIVYDSTDNFYHWPNDFKSGKLSHIAKFYKNIF